MLTRVCKGLFAQSKFKIYKGKYLIEVPPKRTQSSFILFSRDQRPKIPNTSSFKEIQKTLSQKWSNLSQQEKLVYENKAQKLTEKREEEVKEYKEQFVTPFKNISFFNLAVKNYNQKNPTTFKSFAQSSKSMARVLGSINEATKNELQKEAAKINGERQKIRQKYAIPSPEFKSFRSYWRNLQKEKKVGSMKDTSKADLDRVMKDFKELQKKHQEDLNQFAKKFELTGEQLKKLIIKSQKKEEKKEQKKEQSQS